MMRDRATARAAIFAVVAAALLSAQGASAASQRLRGLVLAVPSAGVVLVRHDAVGGMPAMTMPFRVSGTPPVPGDTIVANVSRVSEPWSLAQLRVVAHVALPLAHDAALAVGSRVPDPPFRDQRGRAFRFDSLRGERYAISFIYTRCAEARMCPLISAQYALVQHDPRAASAHLVEVTLDPDFDRPAVLARYARAFRADSLRWTLLTGRPADVLAFVSAFGVQAYPDGRGLLHTERTVIVTADGRIERFLDDARWSPDDLAVALAERPGTWQRLVMAPSSALSWCGDHLGAGGRTAVHHTAVLLAPIAFLAVLVAAVSLGTRRRFTGSR